METPEQIRLRSALYELFADWQYAQMKLQQAPSAHWAQNYENNHWLLLRQAFEAYCKARSATVPTACRVHFCGNTSTCAEHCQKCGTIRPCAEHDLISNPEPTF